MALWLLVPLAGYQTAGVATHPSNQGNHPPSPSIPRRITHGAASQPLSDEVNPFAGYSAEPAPMGITDFGVGQSGAYQYSTSSFVGTASIASLLTRNSTGGSEMSFQLNVNLHFASGNRQYVYWIQDVALLDTSSGLVWFQDNIWNFSAAQADMGASGVLGNGKIYSTSSGSYYGAVASQTLPGNGVDLSYPVTLMLRVNSTLSASKQPQVSFEYSDGGGWQVYDRATFASATGPVSLTGFVVNGFNYNQGGYFDDAEMVMCGAYSGYQTSLVRSDVRFQLQYWNGHNYQMVQNAYNFGGDTAEGIGNVLAEYYYYPSNGAILSEVTPGAGTLGKLYYQTQVGVVTVKSAVLSGTLAIRISSDSAATPARYPFVNGEATVVIYPGGYFLQVYEGGSLYTAGAVTVSAGQHLQALLGQVGLTLDYAVAGSGSGYSAPTLVYTYEGRPQTAVLTLSPATYYVDSGTAWSVSSSLPGSSSKERWATDLTNGTATASQTIVFTYYHQYGVVFSYSVVGGGSPSAPALSYLNFGAGGSVTLSTSPQTVWVDAGSGYSASNPLAGSNAGERWYSSDANGTNPGTGPVAFAYDHQYYLSVTGPGRLSDWYASGSTAVVSTAGVYGRTLGTGERVSSYALDGGPSTSVTPTAGPVSVRVVMDSPHTLSFDSVTQYRLDLGSALQRSLVSITPPPISGDAGWYDAGTPVKLVCNYVWDVKTNQSRTNAVAYDIGGARTALPRAGAGTFTVAAVADNPHSLDVVNVTQYHLSVDGGSAVATSPVSPTGDWFFDAGSSVSVSTGYTWDVAGGESRQNLVSYTLDGNTTSVARAASGTFATPGVAFDGAHSLVFNSVTQFFTSFSFKDSSGTATIVPTRFQLSAQGLGTVDATNGSAWLDGGSAVTVKSLLWEGVDVKPANLVIQVSGAGSETVRARVYGASLKVTDVLGLPVTGAAAEVTLANGTKVDRSTAGDGMVRLALIPLGTFTASVSNLGQTVRVAGDASVEPTTPVGLFVSYPVVGLVVAGLLAVILVLVLAMRRRRPAGAT